MEETMAENFLKLINNSEDPRRINTERSIGRALQIPRHRQGERERAKVQSRQQSRGSWGFCGLAQLERKEPEGEASYHMLPFVYTLGNVD